jgi:hypothetical protein
VSGRIVRNKIIFTGNTGSLVAESGEVAPIIPKSAVEQKHEGHHHYEEENTITYH